VRIDAPTPRIPPGRLTLARARGRPTSTRRCTRGEPPR
jgi:hypothetical protein